MSAEPIHLSNATPFDLIVESIDDALLEARNWADGKEAETQAQVDEIARLIDDLNDNARALEAERVKEKKPLDDQIDAIQTRYNVFLAPLRNKKPGKVPIAIDALNAAKRPFLLAREAEIEAERKRAREEAEAAEKAAADAARAAASDDLAAREAADALAQQAEAARADARRAEKAKAHAHGSGKAQGLRTRRIGTIDNLHQTISDLWLSTRSFDPEIDPFRALAQRAVDEEARKESPRPIRGVTFREERY